MADELQEQDPTIITANNYNNQFSQSQLRSARDRVFVNNMSRISESYFDEEMARKVPRGNRAKSAPPKRMN